MKESLFKIMCHTDTSDSGKSSKRALFQVDSLIDKEGEMQKKCQKIDSFTQKPWSLCYVYVEA